jgi:hypothetical protein
VKLPVLNQSLKIVASGKAYTVTCADVFDGGFAGHYFDALFAKNSRKKFSVGEQCRIPEVSETCLADFVSSDPNDSRKVRFLIPKWA